MSEKMPSDVVVAAWIKLNRARETVLAGVDADLKAAGFPPLSWYDVVLELRRAGAEGLRPMEFEERLLLAQHNVSRLLDRMEKAGLIRREAHESDGRGQRIHATDAGLRLQQQMWPVYGASIERHLGARLDGDDDATALSALLGKLITR